MTYARYKLMVVDNEGSGQVVVEPGLADIFGWFRSEVMADKVAELLNAEERLRQLEIAEKIAMKRKWFPLPESGGWYAARWTGKPAGATDFSEPVIPWQDMQRSQTPSDALIAAEAWFIEHAEDAK